MTTSEKALLLHEKWKGKIETTPKCAIQSREDLALAYTPGVAEPCKVIAQKKEAAYQYTLKANTVAVVSDGSAVLGLGNIGAYAAMPVMEGKAALIKAFGGINAFQFCLDTQDTEEIIQRIVHIAPAFGAPTVFCKSLCMQALPSDNYVKSSSRCFPGGFVRLENSCPDSCSGGCAPYIEVIFFFSFPGPGLSPGDHKLLRYPL